MSDFFSLSCVFSFFVLPLPSLTRSLLDVRSLHRTTRSGVVFIMSSYSSPLLSSIAYPLPLSCFVLIHACLFYHQLLIVIFIRIYIYPTYTRRRWRCTK
ncbi:hypothetical protein ARMGADRAFT_43198 [Armillaria gallica]|uniref:Uncharacterized protein n=1 Tax=Armillaria gallica TaxID=47427 RepID=A0A2H3EUS5_ARMGA|nr:hypothetical protein ARMGADRAFT_43198 [Armillaria gallica]